MRTNKDKPVMICLDVEGVLTPEIWINVAETTGIKELRLTTRDISDYDELMRHRLKVLEQNQLKLKDIQEIIREMNPLPGAEDFLDTLRKKHPVILLSDTFSEFAAPLMEKLGLPALFCNSLIVDDKGRITGYRLRQQDGKRHAVSAMQSIGYTVFASGDSYNDLSMLKTADFGIFFRPPESITKDEPEMPVADNYNDLSAAFFDRMK